MGSLGTSRFRPELRAIAVKVIDSGATGRMTGSGFSRRFAPDLGRDIGTSRWFGELAILIALIALASLFLPGAPLAAPTGFKPEARPRGGPATTIAGTRGAAARDILISPALAADTVTPGLGLTVRPDETLAVTLRRAGVRDEDALRADTLVAAALFPATIVPGTRVSIVLVPTGDAASGDHALARLHARPKLDLDLTVERKGSQLVSLARAIPVETRTLRLQGPLTGNLGASLAAAGAPVELIRQFVDAIDAHQPSLTPDRSLKFDLIATAQRSADGQSRFGDLIYAAVFCEQEPQLELLRWGNDGQFTTARSAPRALPAWPASGRFTSGFGVRFHPILGFERMHAGIDIGAPSGTPIYAVSDGMVSFAGRNGGRGNYVRLDHMDGHGTGYAHMRNVVVMQGDSVVSGQLLGYVGSTGLSTGPHLHFEVYRGGRAVDPLKEQIGTDGPLGASRVQFKSVIEALKSISPPME